MMKMPGKERMLEFYSRLHEKHGFDIRSLDWKDPEGQRARYEALFSIVETTGGGKGFSLADIGCGLGHFYEFLRDRGFIDRHKIRYTGYDINPGLIDAARKKHPGVRFEVKDILEGYFTERFDYVVSCGVFNIRFSRDDEHEAFVAEMLLRMHESARIGAAVDFLSESGRPFAVKKDRGEGSIYYYFRPEDVVRRVRAFTDRFVIRHDYHPADFTVFMLKGEK